MTEHNNHPTNVAAPSPNPSAAPYLPWVRHRPIGNPEFLQTNKEPTMTDTSSTTTTPLPPTPSVSTDPVAPVVAPVVAPATTPTAATTTSSTDPVAPATTPTAATTSSNYSSTPSGWRIVHHKEPLLAWRFAIVFADVNGNDIPDLDQYVKHVTIDFLNKDVKVSFFQPIGVSIHNELAGAASFKIYSVNRSGVTDQLVYSCTSPTLVSLTTELDYSVADYALIIAEFSAGVIG